MRIGDFIVALLIGLGLLWLLNNTQVGHQLFFTVKGSAASS